MNTHQKLKTSTLQCAFAGGSRWAVIGSGAPITYAKKPAHLACGAALYSIGADGTLTPARLNPEPRGWFVTYEIVTPESAEQGDAAERGFISPGGMQCEDRPEPFTLKEALNHCSPQENAGRWLNEVDGRQDYSTGSNETRALHPPRGISAASYARLLRALKIRA